MKETISKIAIGVNIILAGLKIFIGITNYSSAILAEGLHSFIDVFASFISYLGIKIAKKPADEKHPYGHFKFEVLAGLVVTLILVMTGLGIIYEAYQKFLHPTFLKISLISFGVMIFSAIVNEIMARLKINFGKKENSMVLISDGIHSRVDALTSLIVFVGLFLTKYWIYTDAFLAALIGLYIIRESVFLGKEAVDSLLDVSAGKEVEDQIKTITQNLNIHLNYLKTQRKGSVITANLEIILPNNLKIEEATKISETLRKKLMTEIKNLVYVAIQIKSHDVETGFYKPFFGHGFAWWKRGRFKNQEKQEEAMAGKGPGGYCVCLKCGYKISHQAGVPCSSLNCPNYGIPLQRE